MSPEQNRPTAAEDGDQWEHRTLIVPLYLPRLPVDSVPSRAEAIITQHIQLAREEGWQPEDETTSWSALMASERLTAGWFTWKSAAIPLKRQVQIPQAHPTNGGIAPSAVIPLLTSLVALAGPLLPVGAVVTKARIQYFWKLDDATAWSASLLLPKDQLILAGLLFVFSSSALVFTLVIAASILTMAAGLRFGDWLTETPDRSAWCERLYRLLKRLNTIGCSAGSSDRETTAADTDDKGSPPHNDQARPAYDTWYFVGSHVVAVVGLGLASLSLVPSMPHLWIAFVYSVALLSGVALILHLHNWLDFNEAMPSFSPGVANLVIVFAALGLAVSRVVFAVNNQLPNIGYLIAVDLGDSLIFLSMPGNRKDRRRLFRPGPFVLFVHGFTLLCVAVAYILYPAAGKSSVFLASYSSSFYIAGLSAAVAVYIGLQIYLGNLSFTRWIIVAVAFAYMSGIIPITPLDHNATLASAALPGSVPLSSVALCWSNHQAVLGDLLSHSDGNWHVLTYKGYLLATSDDPRGPIVASIPDKDVSGVITGGPGGTAHLLPQIIDVLRRRAATVKEIAADLEMSPNSLNNDVNLLKQHGLIRVDGTRFVSVISEKRFWATAMTLNLGSAPCPAKGSTSKSHR